MIRFGTLGTANITPRALVYPCMDEPGAMIYAIAARDRARAESFAHHHHIRHALDDYQAVIEHPKVDALYNPLHIPAHREWTIKALQAGKHVLCEKSFACNADEATQMAETADSAGLVCMDAYHYRYHPLFIRAKEIYDSGELGQIERIDGAFHIPVTAPADASNIRMNYALGGGVTMDIGCYPISWVRHITGAEPDAIEAEALEGPPLVDVMLTTHMRFGDIEATTSGDMRPEATFTAYLRVEGSDGYMHVHNPLVPQNGHSLEVSVRGQTRMESFDRRPTYGYQLDAFLAAINEGTPLVTDAWDGVRQMQVIDQTYTAAGLPIRGLQDV